MNVLEKKRKNMKHLQEMNDHAFVTWLRNLDPRADIFEVELSWKLDGFFLRFGKDKTGKPWFQTARSPVLYEPMEIIWHALSKGYDHDGMTRAENYFHLIKRLWNSHIMNHIPIDAGLEVEVFDKSCSVLNKETGKRTFVNLAYDDGFFKTDITLFIYKLVIASTGNTWVNGYRYEDLELDTAITTHGSRFAVTLDLGYFRTIASKITDDMMRSLNSLKHADRPTKLATKEIVSQIKQQFCAYVLKEAERFNDMGDDFEGVVITINNSEYKIVTENFRLIMQIKGPLGG